MAEKFVKPIQDDNNNGKGGDGSSKWIPMGDTGIIPPVTSRISDKMLSNILLDTSDTADESRFRVKLPQTFTYNMLVFRLIWKITSDSDSVSDVDSDSDSEHDPKENRWLYFSFPAISLSFTNIDPDTDDLNENAQDVLFLYLSDYIDSYFVSGLGEKAEGQFEKLPENEDDLVKALLDQQEYIEDLYAPEIAQNGQFPIFEFVEYRPVSVTITKEMIIDSYGVSISTLAEQEGTTEDVIKQYIADNNITTFTSLEDKKTKLVSNLEINYEKLWKFIDANANSNSNDTANSANDNQ